MSAEELIIFNRKQSVSSFQSMIVKGVAQYAIKQGIKHTDVCRVLQAQKIKICRQSFYDLQRGTYQRQLSLYTLIAICEAVGKSINDFITVHQPNED